MDLEVSSLYLDKVEASELSLRFLPKMGKLVSIIDDHPDLGFLMQEKLDIDFAAAKYAKALAAVQAHGCFFPSGLRFVGFSIYWVVDGLAWQRC